MEIGAEVTQIVVQRLNELGHWPSEDNDLLEAQYAARFEEFIDVTTELLSEHSSLLETNKVTATTVTKKHLQIRRDSVSTALDAAIVAMFVGWFAKVATLNRGLRLV